MVRQWFASLDTNTLSFMNTDRTVEFFEALTEAFPDEQWFSDTLTDLKLMQSATEVNITP